MKFRIIAALAMAGALAFGSAAHSAGRVTLGTNPQGSIYYTIGGGIAAALQDKLGRQVTVQPYTGSSVYLPLISSGEVTMGLNSSLDVGAFYRGENGEPLGNLRVLARLWPLRYALVARGDSDLTKVSDLEGKRVVTDFAALAAMGRANTSILEAAGLSEDQVQGTKVASLKPGLDGLTDNSLDATGIAVGIPLTQQAHASIPGGIRYLSIDGDNATTEFLDGIYPGLYTQTLKPNPRLPEVTEPITIAGFDVYLTTSADLSDEDATAILTALHDSWPQLREDYPPIRGGMQDAMSRASNTVPYHPAAVAFFKSKGLWDDDNDARESGLK